MTIIRLATCLLLLCCVSFAQAQSTEPAASQPANFQRGEFHATFTERSPLSTPKEIARRIVAKTAGDYDLAADKFSVYVPKNYDPATPCGVIVFLCYKHSEETAPTLHDIFDKDHLIFVTTQEMPATPAERIGTALDAVFNLSNQYKIDPNRIWVFGAQPANELGLAFPDVFSAGIYREPLFYRGVQSTKTGGMYPPTMTHPLAEYVTRAKAHRQVFMLFANPDEYHLLAIKALKSDGFKQLLTLEVTLDAYHYPNFTTDWFEQIVAFLDAPPTPEMAAAGKAVAHVTRAHAAPAAGTGGGPATPTVAPTTTAPAESTAHAPAAPTQSDPQRMLSLAKSYISAKAYAPARKRLNAIIEQFPTAPAATEAKQLLDSLPPAQ